MVTFSVRFGNFGLFNQRVRICQVYMILQLLYNYLIWGHIYWNFRNENLFCSLLRLHWRLRSLDLIERLLDLDLITNFWIVPDQCRCVRLKLLSIRILLAKSFDFRTCRRCGSTVAFSWLAPFRPIKRSIPSLLSLVNLFDKSSLISLLCLK